MKNLQILTLMMGLICSISCKAQQTMPLNTPLWNIPANTHIKDLNNELPPYIGNYKAIYEGKEIILYITFEPDRFEKSTKKNYYQDVLVIKYIVKNSSGQILQDTQNLNNPNIELYSIGTFPAQNKVDFYYSGTNCGVGYGTIYLSKINNTQIKWDYIPEEVRTETCPTGTDINIYLPVTKGLIFTKQ